MPSRRLRDRPHRRAPRLRRSPQPRSAPLLRRALVAALALALPLLAAIPAASAATSADWQLLSTCESGGNWQINTGNGYYGGLQFSFTTWLGFGGGAYAPRADLATPEQQMDIANRVLAVQGWDAWPSCSRQVGLYGTPTGPPPPQPQPQPLVIGAILGHYTALGGTGGFLGAPLTSEQGTPNGLGRYNHFVGGSIYWTPAQGAWSVRGAIRGTWAEMGWESSLLGFPLSDEHPLQAGAFSSFQGGSIHWSPATGAHETHGAIGVAWGALGYENGPLGYPVTNETPTPARPGAFNHFTGGSVYWSPATGAHEVVGAIRATWASMGWENSALGFPTSDEYAIPGGRRSDFQGGSLTWTPTGGVHLRRR